MILTKAVYQKIANGGVFWQRVQCMLSGWVNPHHTFQDKPSVHAMSHICWLRWPILLETSVLQWASGWDGKILNTLLETTSLNESHTEMTQLWAYINLLLRWFILKTNPLPMFNGLITSWGKPPTTSPMWRCLNPQDKWNELILSCIIVNINFR